MTENWAVEETGAVDLKDKRLNKRLIALIYVLSKKPPASIPCSSGGHAEMTAAYRLFDNPKATLERIMLPHAEATIRRITEHKTVLLAQDTTEIDVTRPEQQVRGTGPLSENTRWGVFLHPLVAITPDGIPLGTVGLKHWTRDEERKTIKDKTRSERAATPIEDKESYRWVQLKQRAEEIAAKCPATQIICVSDSEADIYEMFTEKTSLNWIIRGCQDRALMDGQQARAENYIRKSVLNQPAMYETVVNVRTRTPKIGCDERGRRQPRAPRKAVCDVRSVRVTLRPPWRPLPNKLQPVKINVVLVREISPPPGEEPVEWLLLTDLPINSEDSIRNVIELYATRWVIEIFFKVLKSGCQVEKRRFENIARLRACVAVYMIIAWRTLYACRLARSVPDISCEAVFEPDEWKPVWQIIRKSTPPKEPPTLQEMTCMVAQLGGYIKRKSSPPGPQTIWIGIQRAYDFALCWRSFGPDVGKKRKDV